MFDFNGGGDTCYFHVLILGEHCCTHFHKIPLTSEKKIRISEHEYSVRVLRTQCEICPFGLIT